MQSSEKILRSLIKEALRKGKSRGKAKTVALGDCYDAAGKYILNKSTLYMGSGGEVRGDVGEASNLVLVHAEVNGQGPMEGTTFGHGFVWDKSSDIVIDRSNGRNIQLPKILYFAIGGVDEIGNFYLYTPQQMVENMIKYKHWGPWDLKTSSGL